MAQSAVLKVFRATLYFDPNQLKQIFATKITNIVAINC